MKHQVLIRFLLLCCAVAALSFPTAAQDPRGGGALTTVPAGLPEESRQFDFWIGKWTVVDANGGGGIPGADTVKNFGNGLAILETYKSGNSTGSSVTTYNITTKTWTQTWQDSSGFLFQLTGSKQGDQIVLTGDFLDTQDNKVKLGRLTFSNITKSEFIQKFEQSTDAGKNWTALYTARFTKGK